MHQPFAIIIPLTGNKEEEHYQFGGLLWLLHLPWLDSKNIWVSCKDFGVSSEYITFMPENKRFPIEFIDAKVSNQFHLAKFLCTNNENIERAYIVTHYLLSW